MAEETKKKKDFFKKVSNYVREIRSELKKVIWLSREQLINNTVTVLLACLVMGVIIWTVDGGLGVIRGWIYNIK